MLRHVSVAVTLFVLTAHLSELFRAVQHITVIEVLTTLALFTIWVGAHKGTAGEL